MIKVSPLTDKLVHPFKSLFTEYYKELDCEENIENLIEEYIMPDLLAGLINIDILENDENPVGFVIYQTDDITNDWNFKEGWGDIREIYVVRSLRRQGLGKFLLFTAEMKLRESGTNKAYVLPVENSLPFFTACGYKKTDEVCEELACPVCEKLSLNNCCNKT